MLLPELALSQRIDGKRYSRGRVKLGAIAPPPLARRPPSTHNSTEFPPITRSPRNTRPPRARDSQTSLQLAFSVARPPPLSQQQASPLPARNISFQPSRATRAATLSPMPPIVEPYYENEYRKKHLGSAFVRSLWSSAVFSLFFLSRQILFNVCVFGFEKLAVELMWWFHNLYST